MTMHYPVIVERESNGTCSAWVAGLPGVYVAADTAAAAKRVIRSVLIVHLRQARVFGRRPGAACGRLSASLRHAGTHLPRQPALRGDGRAEAVVSAALVMKKLRHAMSAKETVRAVLDRLPEDCSLDDVLHYLYVARTVQQGRSDARADRVISHGQVEAELRRT